MENYKLVKDDILIKVYIAFVPAFGRSAAGFLSQLHDLIEEKHISVQEHEGKPWFCLGSSEKWAERLAMNPRTFQRIVSGLVKLGVVQIRRFTKCMASRANHYTIDYQLRQSHLKNYPPVKHPQTHDSVWCRVDNSTHDD